MDQDQPNLTGKQKKNEDIFFLVLLNNFTWVPVPTHLVKNISRCCVLCYLAENTAGLCGHFPGQIYRIEPATPAALKSEKIKIKIRLIRSERVTSSKFVTLIYLRQF